MLKTFKGNSTGSDQKLVLQDAISHSFLSDYGFK